MPFTEKSKGWMLLSAAYAVSACAVASASWLAWEFTRASPALGEDLLGVQPVERVLDRGRGQSALITRRICLARPASFIVEREWVDEAGGILPMLEGRWDGNFTGCRQAPTYRVYPPAMLGEGYHTYRVRLRWCNALKCVPHSFTDIGFTVLGAYPSDRRRGLDGFVTQPTQGPSPPAFDVPALPKE